MTDWDRMLGMVLLTAYVALLPDKIEAALEACRTVRGHSVLEPGCERYDFFQSPDDETKVVFVEEWSSKADLDVHFQQAPFLEFMAAMGGFLQGPPSIRSFESSLIG